MEVLGSKGTDQLPTWEIKQPEYASMNIYLE